MALAGTSSTANLVRLLREAEQGQGLETDFSDALGEALAHHGDPGEGTPKATLKQLNGARRSFTKLGTVPYLNRKRLSRVVAGQFNTSEGNATKSRPRQHRQEFKQANSFHTETHQNPGTAPCSGGLIATTPPVPTMPHKVESLTAEISSTSQFAAKLSPVTEDRAHHVVVQCINGSDGYHGGTSGSSRKQQQQQQQQCRRKHSLGLSHQLSPSSTSLGQCLNADAPMKIDHSKSIAMVTKTSIRQPHAPLRRQLHARRSGYENNANFQGDARVGQQSEESQAPLLSASRECDEATVGTSPRKIAAVIPYFGVRDVGNIPTVPTGAPAMPSRRDVGEREPPTTQEKRAVVMPPVTIPTTAFEAIYNPQAAQQKGVQAVEPRVTGAPLAAARRGVVNAAAALVTTAAASVAVAKKQQRQQIRASPPQQPATAADGRTFPNASPAMTSMMLTADPQSPVSNVQSRTLGKGAGGGRRDLESFPVEPCTVGLAAGLGFWANDTAAVGRLIDDDSRRMADERSEESREEARIRRALERGIGATVKSLPLSFLKDYGYLAEAQKRGLERTMRIIKRVAGVALLAAWKKWKNVRVGPRFLTPAAGSGPTVCAAVARGFLGRRRAAEMRRQRDDAAAQNADRKGHLLQLRLAKVSAASRTVASFLVANAAARRRDRRRLAREAVAKVERMYLAREVRQQGWREIVMYRQEHAAAGVIQRWTRGVLVRRRTKLLRRIRRMELNDARFAIRDEVFLAHLVDHGAAVIIQKWWRTLPWRMRRLRKRYRNLLDRRATAIQRAYRRQLMRRGHDKNGAVNRIAWGKLGALVPSKVTTGSGLDNLARFIPTNLKRPRVPLQDSAPQATPTEVGEHLSLKRMVEGQKVMNLIDAVPRPRVAVVTRDAAVTTKKKMPPADNKEKEQLSRIRPAQIRGRFPRIRGGNEAENGSRDVTNL